MLEGQLDRRGGAVATITGSDYPRGARKITDSIDYLGFRACGF